MLLILYILYEGGLKSSWPDQKSSLKIKFDVWSNFSTIMYVDNHICYSVTINKIE